MGGLLIKFCWEPFVIEENSQVSDLVILSEAKNPARNTWQVPEKTKVLCLSSERDASEDLSMTDLLPK